MDFQKQKNTNQNSVKGKVGKDLIWITLFSAITSSVEEDEFKGEDGESEVLRLVSKDICK